MLLSERQKLRMLEYEATLWAKRAWDCGPAEGDPEQYLKKQT